MTNPNPRPKALEEITLTSAYVNDAHRFAFVGQRFVNDDAWHHVQTFVIFYDTRKHGDKRWTIHKLEYMTDAGGVKGALVSKPQKEWVFGFINTGYMIIFNEDGEITGIENIPIEKDYTRVILTGIDEVESAYGISTGRNVWKRLEKNKWSFFRKDFPQINYLSEENKKISLSSQHGFDAIAGFSDNDIYACGGDGDLWHYNGEIWEQKEMPTNSSFEHICCGEDGLVYIATGHRTMVVGRDERWDVVEQDLTSEVFEHIVWYQDRCYISTQYKLYEIAEGKFQEAKIAKKGLDHAPTHIAARGNTFLAVSGLQGEVSYYDGEQWHKVIHIERPPKDPNQPSFQEFMNKLMKEHKDKYGS